MLDYQRIRPAERETAKRWASSAAGAALEQDVGFTPGESTDGQSVVTTFSAEEKEQIRNLLTNAKSVQEIEAIEASVRKGLLPEELLPPAKRQKTS